MLLKMFSMYDAKAEIFNNPFFKSTPGEAERDFRTAVNDPKSGHLHQYPEDYDLFFLGEYDDQTGKINALQTPQHVVKALQLKEGYQPPTPPAKALKKNPKGLQPVQPRA